MCLDLFVEERVRQEGFERLEDYLRYYLKDLVSPAFHDVRTFRSFLDAGLIVAGMAVRTSTGNIDEEYWVTEDGKLQGETKCPYPGKEGIFEPEEILHGDRISSGWTIENTLKLSYLCR